jgi:hypothetical protein
VLAYAGAVPWSDADLVEAMIQQAGACANLGSPQYERLIRGLADDVRRGGLVHELLHERPEGPLRDALILRLLGAIHRIVLRGDAPGLAARYGSAGGDGSPIPVEEFLAVVDANRQEVISGLGENVQTNEVGRAAALIVGFAAVARRFGLPLNMLEIGASAGLISNWDRYLYDSHGSTTGAGHSPVRFTTRWDEPFDLSGLTPVVARAACDISPLDASDPECRRRLLSFIWPDQTERFEVLNGALEVAEQFPPEVDAADAGEWLDKRLAERPDGTTTIVFHSIVWQYLPRSTKDHMREVLRREGAAADLRRPVAWVRLEPAAERADLRITTWPGAAEEIMALSSYHGAGIRRPG